MTFLTIHSNNRIVYKLIIASCCGMGNLNVRNKIMTNIFASTVTNAKDFLCGKDFKLILLYFVFGNYLCKFVKVFNMPPKKIRLED